MTSPTVYLIEDDEGSRNSTVCLLEVHGLSAKGFESAEQFLSVEIENPIGCIVTDLILPGISGLELFQRTRVLGWTMPTIIFTAFGDVGSVVRAFRCGIFHYLEKPFSSEKLIQSVKECLASCEKTHEMEKGRKDALLLLSRLTRKEREVLDLLVRGKSMKEICTEFATSFQSVSALRKRMLTKLDIGGDVLLAQWMRKHNLD